MNSRNLLIAAVIIVGGLVLLNYKSLSSKLLPSGKLQEENNMDSAKIVTDEPITGKPQVEITTSKGKIVLELRPDVAPKTVANYLGKWANGSCNGRTFHRVEDWVVQGCDPKGDGTGGESSLPTETSSESFTTGSLGVARRAVPKDVSNDSQFFIVKSDSTFLNGDYTYFGKVISGMDVVNALAVGDKIVQTTVLSK